MDKRKDNAVYYELSDWRADEATFSQRRNIIHTRMIKLSLPTTIDMTYRIMGSELLASGQFKKSIPLLKKAVLINPDNYAQLDLIKAFFKLEKENEAFNYLKRTLSLKPEDDVFHYLLIEELKERDHLEDLEYFSNEIANMIADPESVSIFYLASAEALLHSDMFPQALGAYRKAMESNPPMGFNHHYNYGLALYHEGLFEEAIVQFERARNINPNSSHVLNSIAHMNYCLSRVQKAKEEFEYIIQNGLEINSTVSNFLLVLYHIDADKELINQYKERVKQSLASNGSGLLKLYNTELRITQTLLDRNDIDEETREFNIQKLKGINQVLSLITEVKDSGEVEEA